MQAVGQKTILDYNDAISLSTLRYANRGELQIIIQTGEALTDTYTAATTWKEAGQTTPSGSTPANWAPRTAQQYLFCGAFKQGDTVDKLALAQSGANVDDIKWTIGADLYTLNKSNSRWSKNSVELGSGGQYATDGNYFFQTVAPYGLIIVDNVMTSASQSLKIRFNYSYTDPTTALKVYGEQVYNLGAVLNGVGAYFVNVAIPDGDTIRGGLPASVRLQAEMYANGALDSTSPGTIVWAVYNPSTTNWDTISHVTNQTELSTINGITSGQLKIFDVALIGTEVYRATVTRSGTDYVQYVTISDITDPILCTPYSSNGDLLKNGQGSTTLTAKLTTSTGEVDNAGTVYDYAWEAFDSNGTATKFRSNAIFSTTLTSQANAGQAVVNVASVGANRQGIAVGDTLIANAGLSTEQIMVVQSIATLAITMTAPLTQAIANGAAIYVVDKVAGSSTVASGSSGTTLNVASGTTFIGGAGEAGDIIVVGSGDTAEYRRVTAKATNALTLDKPLSAANYTVGVAVARKNNLRLGKALTVGETDVSVKGTFSCYVS